MKTVRIIDGKAMICQTIEANYQGDPKEFAPVRFYISALIKCVEKRMESCMKKLTEAIDTNEIIDSMPVEIGGKEAQNILFTDGTSFVTASYETMESLLNKLRELGKDRFVEKVSVEHLGEVLTFLEADQLFKCYSFSGHTWGNRGLIALDNLRDYLRTVEFQQHAEV